MISIETFLVIESSLTGYVSRLLKEASASVYALVDAALAEGDTAAALEALNTLSLANLREEAEGYVAFMTYMAMLFGASRVTQKPETSVVGLGFERMRVKQLTDAFCTSITQKAEFHLKKAGEARIASVQKAEPVLKPFSSFMNAQGKAYMNLVSSLHSSRVSAYGFTSEAEALGITEYQINERLDSRTCPVCELMHGKTFPVEEARQTLDVVTRVTDPDELKRLQPWPKQTAAALEELKGLSEDDLIQKNWHIPPFHPGCRGLLYRSGRVPPKPAAGEDYPPEKYEATSADFKAMKVYLNDTQIKTWNKSVGLSPVEVVARLTGQPVADFALSLLEADKPKQFAGLRSLSVSKNITLSLSKAGFGSKEVFDQRVKFIPERRSLYLEAVELHETDQASGIAKRYLRELYTLAKDAELTQIELLAGLDVGGYAWAKYGFKPDLVSWKALKADIQARVTATKYLNGLTPSETTLYKAIMASDDPASIFALADVKFGKDLLLGQKWAGSLALSDAESVIRFLTYIGEL